IGRWVRVRPVEGDEGNLLTTKPRHCSLRGLGTAPYRPNDGGSQAERDSAAEPRREFATETRSTRRTLSPWRELLYGLRGLAVLNIVHLHDLRLAGVSAELLHDG